MEQKHEDNFSMHKIAWRVLYTLCDVYRCSVRMPRKEMMMGKSKKMKNRPLVN
jgi:hypothetical protein